MDTTKSSNSKDFLIARLFVVTVREFFDNTTLHGFKYLIKQGISTFEKWKEIRKILVYLFRFNFNTFTLFNIIGYFGMWFNYVRWPEQATSFYMHSMGSLLSQQLHRSKVTTIQLKKSLSRLLPFARWIESARKRPWNMRLNCEQNLCYKQLKMLFRTFSMFWHSRSQRTKNHSVEWLFKNIQYLGHALDHDTVDYDKYIIFQDLLDSIDVNNETLLFDTQDKYEFKVVLCNFHWMPID